MITENLSTLKIHKLTQEQYDRELASGNIDESAIYLTPDKISQSDWNQNDETAKDYIKNRPFYSYPIEPTLCDGTFTYETLPNGKIGIYLPDGFSLGEKQHYNITAVDFVFNNAYCESNSISWYVNRLNVVITYIEEDGKWAYWYDGGVVGESFYLKIEDARGNIGYKTIDVEYLPQGLGMPGSGEKSWAFNYEDNIASGHYSIAEGQKTTASGGNSHAEGLSTTASGSYSHAEGFGTIASSMSSHAEGSFTIAASGSQHVQGQYNIEDKSRVYAHIVGNGKATGRSNAHTVDWSGNAWYAGDVYVGSTSGTNRDDGSKKLATEEYVNENITSLTTNLDNYYLKSEANTLHTEIKDYVDTEVAALVNSAPETLDTLGELATAFQENEEVVEVLNQAIATKYSDDNQPPYPVLSVDGKTGSVELNYEVWTFTLADGTTVTKNVVIK